VRLYFQRGILSPGSIARELSNALQVGIYMLIDVNSPLVGQSIDRGAPWTTYDSSYLNRTFAVVEAFKDYPNTLLFFAGNEVINDDPSGKIVPPYMRVSPLVSHLTSRILTLQAVTRDLKNYIKNHATRTIPVGYSAADVRDILVDTWNYLQCTTTGDDSDMSRVDLFALNSYSWCGDSSFTTSGYDKLVANFSSTSVPVFFSEYGCNVPAPRVFTEVPVLYGPQMTPVLSGGMVYEYSEEASDYGLVNLNSNGSAQCLPDYDTLQKQFASLNVTALQGLPAQNTSIKPPTCSESIITGPTFNSNFTLPDVPPGAQALIDKGISPAPVGKLVSVTDTKVTQVVQASNGQVIQGLSISLLANDESNTPRPQSSISSSSSSSSSSSPMSTTGSATAAATTNSKKSAATAVQRNWGSLAIAGIVAVSWFSLV
jgi:hypothetical protein